MYGTSSKQTNFNLKPKEDEEEKLQQEENLNNDYNQNIVISPLKFKQNFNSAKVSKKGSIDRILNCSKMVSTGTQSNDVNCTKIETFIKDPRDIYEYSYIDHLDKVNQNFKGPSSQLNSTSVQNSQFNSYLSSLKIARRSRNPMKSLIQNSGSNKNVKMNNFGHSFRILKHQQKKASKITTHQWISCRQDALNSKTSYWQIASNRRMDRN